MRIGHLSDIHLRHHLPGTSDIPVRRSREGPALLERALAAMRADGVEVVAVTGDLLDIPGYQLTDETRAELGAAVVDDYRLCHRLLTGGGLPFVVVPGNHDDAALMAEVFATGTGTVDIGGVRFVGFWDSEGPGNVPRRVGAEAALFERLCGEAGPQVHLQHYLLTESPSTEWPFSYANHAELLARVTASGSPRLVLSGHYHPGLPAVTVGNTVVSTVAALCERPHHYRTYEVTEASIVTREHALSP